MDNIYYIMDSSSYARKYMKYKLKYKNLQKSIVQAGGNKYKYRIWDTGVVEFVDMEKRIDTNMDEEDKKQLFEFIETNHEKGNNDKIKAKKYKVLMIESGYVPIFKRSLSKDISLKRLDDLLKIRMENVKPAAVAPLQHVVLSQAAEPLQAAELSQPAKNTDIKTITLPNVGVYEGTLLEGMPHGKGTLNYFNGDKYTGDFVNGHQHGSGTMKYSNNAEYIGEYVNGIQNGKGTFKFISGDEYTGDFVNEFRHGTGTMKYINGNKYTGDFVYDKRSDRGTLTFPNGDKYDGFLLEGDPHGKGIMKYNNKDIYKGNFVHGRRHGKGVMKYANKCEYDGDYVYNKRNGIGILTFADGDKYVGNFINGNPHSKGKYVYSDGIIYEGDFTNGDADVLRPVDTKISEPYSITLFMNAHGCEIKDLKLPVIYPNIELQYLNSTDFGCENVSKSDKDIAHASILFNTNTHIEAVEKYRKKKGRSGASKHNREYNRKFGFGSDVTSEKPDNYNIFDGIIIIQNTLGLPNNVNLFNFTKPDRINVSINDTITEFSRMLVEKLFMENYHNTLALSALLGIINDWFSRKFQGEKIPGKKLNLTIIDNSCRVYCDTDRIE
jgi:hypothetical protein